MTSYYEATRTYPRIGGEAAGDLACDVCVVGGGYTGLSAALILAEAGRDVVLVEAGDVGDGASGRNGGQLGSAHVVLQPELEKIYGPEPARALWHISEAAKAEVKSLIERHGIACDYRPGNVGCAATVSDMDVFKRHVDMVSKAYGYDCYEVHDRSATAALTGCELYKGSINDPSAGHLHPLNLALGLARAARKAGVRIFCDSPVMALDEGPPIRLQMPGARIRAGHAILACNGYGQSRSSDGSDPGFARDLAGRIMPLDSFQMASEPLDEETFASILTNDACFWDSHRQVYYFRKTNDRRLLFGGGLGVPQAPPKKPQDLVRSHLAKVFPRLADIGIDFVWGGTLAVTRSGLPDMGRLGPDVSYAQGYNGHGVALANLCGRLLGESVAGPSEGFDLFASIAPKAYPVPDFLRGPVLRAGFMTFSLIDAIRGLR